MSALRGHRARRPFLLSLLVLLVFAWKHRSRRKPNAWPPRAAAEARPGAPRASASSRPAARQARGRGRRAPGRGLTVPTSVTRHARPPRRSRPGSAVLRLGAPTSRPRAAPAAPPPRSPARARRSPPPARPPPPALRLLQHRDARSGEKRRAAAAAGTSTRERGGRSGRAAVGGGGAPRPRLPLSRERTCTAGGRRGRPGEVGALGHFSRG